MCHLISFLKVVCWVAVVELADVCGVVSRSQVSTFKTPKVGIQSPRKTHLSWRRQDGADTRLFRNRFKTAGVTSTNRPTTIVLIAKHRNRFRSFDRAAGIEASEIAQSPNLGIVVRACGLPAKIEFHGTLHEMGAQANIDSWFVPFGRPFGHLCPSIRSLGSTENGSVRIDWIQFVYD